MKVQQAFLKELMTLQACRNPYIVQILYWNMATAGHYFLVTELMVKGSLADCIKKDLAAGTTEFAWVDAAWGWRICMDALRGVCFLHSKGLVHNDLKPANILVDENNRGKVGDVGLAGDTGTRAEGATRAFAPPEVFKGGATDRSDMYSIGVVGA
jgi:serine/threonine protein kinase